MSAFLQLVRSRLDSNTTTNHIAGTFIRTTPKLMSITGESSVPMTTVTFNLSQLQEDVISTYLSGKPIIRDVTSLRTLFKFRHGRTAVVKRTISEWVRNLTVNLIPYLVILILAVYVLKIAPKYSHIINLLFPFSPMGGAYSLATVEDSLHPLLRLPLPDGLERRIVYEFHSASYHSLTEIVVGLKTALGHLIKTVPPEGSVNHEIREASLRSFISNEFDDHLNEQSTNVLAEIGIRKWGGRERERGR